MAKEEPLGLPAVPPKTTSTDLSVTRNLLDSTVREDLVRLCTLYDRDFNPLWVPLWKESLANIEPSEVHAAFLQVEKQFIPSMACPFPTPAHIHSVLAETAAGRAELIWQDILQQVRKQYHPDLGWRGEKIDEEFVPAIKAAGGVHYLWNATGEQLVWAKKEFMAAMMRRTL